MTRIRLTYRALEDLDDIYKRSIRKWGEIVADQYIKQIEESLKLLEEYPKLLKINAKISGRFKVYPSGRHFLVCDIVEEEIYILTIQHMNMDLMNRLKDLAPMLEDEAKALYQKLKRSR